MYVYKIFNSEHYGEWMEELTILTVVENDPGLFELMVKSVQKFTSCPVKFIVCDNSNGKNLNKAFAVNANIQIIRNNPKFLGGSRRHGDGLNKIMPLVQTKYTAIIESDMAILSPDWHKMDSKFKILAAEKQKGFYHICFMAFKTDLLKNVDFRPGTDDKDRASKNNFDITKDVGWRLSQTINEDEVDKMTFVDCKLGKGMLFDKTFQSDEFQKDGKLIACHLGRGSNLSGKAVRKGFEHPIEQTKRWKAVIEKILEK